MNSERSIGRMNRHETVVSVVNELMEVSKKAPCKKTLQKIVYLIEEAGGPKKFDYTIHFYGPYSADVDFEIQKLTEVGYLFINYTDSGHLIEPTEEAKAHGISKLPAEEKQIVNLFGKESPSSLELLATTLFVQRETKATDYGSILPGVKKIKGSKYSDSQIQTAVKKLHEQRYF